MEITEELIAALDFCASHNAEIHFIHSLHDSGLIEVIIIRETPYLHLNDLPQLEKMVRLHYEMDINLEGIEAISRLWQQIDELQKELTGLQQQLRLHSENWHQ